MYALANARTYVYMYVHSLTHSYTQNYICSTHTYTHTLTHTTQYHLITLVARNNNINMIMVRTTMEYDGNTDHNPWICACGNEIRNVNVHDWP